MTPRDLPILLPLIGLLLYGAAILAVIAGMAAAIYFIGLGIFYGFLWLGEASADIIDWFINGKIYLFSFLLIPIGIIWYGWKAEQRKAKAKQVKRFHNNKTTRR
jgi:hypothetical protein